MTTGLQEPLEKTIMMIFKQTGSLFYINTCGVSSHSYDHICMPKAVVAKKIKMQQIVIPFWTVSSYIVISLKIKFLLHHKEFDF